ncbi:MAG TPA: epimerase, partial [Planctomycetota bacterium]|nr:epimerase [Planctomycetota bacterium]
CEEAAAAAFPRTATLVRPGYIVGPDDDSGRFAYWPARLRDGGECLAPGAQDNDLQFIDVNDLGEWIVHTIEAGIAGTFNAVGFARPLTTGEFLAAAVAALKSECTLTWVDDAFLQAHEIGAWEQLPCWTPKEKNGHTSNQKMVAAGAKFRPIADTIRATDEWLQQQKTGLPVGKNLTRAQERELLAAWRKQKNG